MTSTSAEDQSTRQAALGWRGIKPKWWILGAVGVGTFMSALDASVANIVLPVVSQDLHSDIATVEWVVTIYLLVVSGLLLSLGRLGDLKGHKPVYLIGYIIFVVGSALSGLAQSAEMLVGFRAVQAVGAAALFANSPAILTKNFPAEQRGQTLGLQATMTYLGLTVGPSLGGWLTSHLTWHAVFFINIPIGLLGLLMTLAFVPNDRAGERGERFDLAGAATFTGGLVALLLALNQGSAWGWGSLAVHVSLAAAIILLCGFLAIERRVPYPMLDLSLFKSRLFTAAAGSAILNYVCVYTILFYLPFYLIQGRGLDPAQAGLVLTAQPLVMAIAAPLSGTLSDRVGSRLPGTVGMGILGVGLFLLSRLGAVSPISSVALALAIAGLGTGAFTSPNNSALMGAAPRNRQGIAAGVLATCRNVGMVLGVGLAGAILTTVMGNTATTSPLLFNAIDTGFVVATGVAAIGMLTSAVRGS